jgi:hypothetical protein
MAKVKMYINKEIAAMFGCSVEAVVKFAQKPENEINFIGSGRRKIYIWFTEDIARFKNRDTTRGRPKKAPAPAKTAPKAKKAKK